MSKIAIVTGANKGVGFFIAQQQLDVSDNGSIDAFVESYTKEFGSLDILVNNAGIAQASSAYDSPEFRATAKSTLQTNYYGLWRLSDGLLPLLRKAPAPRLVNVASGLGHKAHLSSDAEREAYSSETVTLAQLDSFVQQFIKDTEAGLPTITEALAAKGFPSIYSVYSYSKIALIAATRVYARDPANSRVLINASCPGFCATDLNGNAGPRPPAEGAKTPVLLALLPEGSTVTGRFYENEADSEW
eukprot:gene39835-49228_t